MFSLRFAAYSATRWSSLSPVGNSMVMWSAPNVSATFQMYSYSASGISRVGGSLKA